MQLVFQLKNVFSRNLSQARFKIESIHFATQMPWDTKNISVNVIWLITFYYIVSTKRTCTVYTVSMNMISGTFAWYAECSSHANPIVPSQFTLINQNAKAHQDDYHVWHKSQLPPAHINILTLQHRNISLHLKCNLLTYKFMQR